jgi:hypothetical protein
MQLSGIKESHSDDASESMRVADPRGVVGVSLLVQYVISSCWGMDPLYEGLASLLSLFSP